MERKSLDERKKILPNKNLLDFSEKRISYDSKLQNEIVHVLEKGDVFAEFIKHENLVESVLFYIENGGMNYENEHVAKLLPEFEKMITPEMFKKFQKIPGLDYKDYLKGLLQRFHGIFNKRRGMYGHLFNPITYEEKTTYSPEKYTILRKINREDQSIAFYTLLFELFVSKEKIR